MSEPANNAAPSPLALGAVAVICGACLMVLEICGARMIEPEMGNSVYVWGSIIGVFMIALTVGYFVGGQLADRWPRAEWLGAAILLAGLCCFLIPPVATPLCRVINEGSRMAVPMRALVASLLLFLAPSVLLGVVSPFVLRLCARGVSKVGSLAGTLYAVSSAGSIVGTFLATFLLPEVVGIHKTVWGVGVILVAAGVSTMALGVAARRKTGVAAGGAAVGVAAVLALGGAVGGVAAGAWEPSMPPIVAWYFAKYPEAGREGPRDRWVAADVLEVRESAYHHITIVEGDSNLTPRGMKPVPARYMLFNNQMESGIELVRPSRTDNGDTPVGGLRLVQLEDMAPPLRPARTACGYVNMLHLGIAATGTAPKRVLVIGCGGGVGPLMMRDYFSGERGLERIDVVDIDAAVFELAEKYFDFPYTREDPVIRSYVEDGRLFMQARPDEKWDYIVMDAYTSGGRIPKHLVTKEFFDLCRARLSPGGLVLGNIISGVEAPPGGGADLSRLYRSVYKTMSASLDTDAGGQLLVFPRNNFGHRFENIIMVAWPPESFVEGLRTRHDFTSLARTWAGAKRDLLAHIADPLDDVVARARFTAPTLDDVPLLTDDFCPTDRMSAR